MYYELCFNPYNHTSLAIREDQYSISLFHTMYYGKYLDRLQRCTNLYNPVLSCTTLYKRLQCSTTVCNLMKSIQPCTILYNPIQIITTVCNLTIQYNTVQLYKTLNSSIQPCTTSTQVKKLDYISSVYVIIAKGNYIIIVVHG